MLSKHTRKFLRRLSCHDEGYYYLNQLHEITNMKVDFPFLQELCEQGYLRRLEPFDFCPPHDEFSDPEYIYRIADLGKAALELHSEHIFTETRAWITAAIAVAAFIKSFFF